MCVLGVPPLLPATWPTSGSVLRSLLSCTSMKVGSLCVLPVSSQQSQVELHGKCVVRSSACQELPSLEVCAFSCAFSGGKSRLV